MAWTIKYAESVRKSLKAIDRVSRDRIEAFLEKRVAEADDPRQLGKALRGNVFFDLWRYRVGDYRIIAQILDSEITVVVVRVGHRKDVYR